MTLELRQMATEESLSGLYSDLLELNGKRRRIDPALVLAKDHDQSHFSARNHEKSSESQSAHESQPSTAEKSYCRDQGTEQDQQLQSLEQLETNSGLLPVKLDFECFLDAEDLPSKHTRDQHFDSLF